MRHQFKNNYALPFADAADLFEYPFELYERLQHGAVLFCVSDGVVVWHLGLML